MRIEDRIQDTELKLIKALYEHGKEKSTEVTYDAPSFNLYAILDELRMSENEARPALKNLVDFDFLEWDKDSVKLLPSGIKYSIGQFEQA